jgi:hypothetical protein
LALVGLAAMALGACGGSPIDSPVAPAVVVDDATVINGAGAVSTLGYGPGPGGPNELAGDGTCDGTGYGPGDGICDGTCDGTSPGPGPNGGRGPGNGYGPGDGTCDGEGYGPGDGTCDGTCDGTAVGPDPDDLQTVLVEALQEEYKAEQTYRRVLADFGSVAPFAAIANSEQQHVQAILRLFERREWTAPASIYSLGNVAVFDTLTAACAGGVAVEIEDAALYDGYLSRGDLPRDVVNVFTNLRAASLERHLPAFQACQ